MSFERPGRELLEPLALDDYQREADAILALVPAADRIHAYGFDANRAAVLGEGQSAAAALRQAQLEMRTETRWQAPYFWAAFTLQGGSYTD